MARQDHDFAAAVIFYKKAVNTTKKITVRSALDSAFDSLEFFSDAIDLRARPTYAKRLQVSAGMVLLARSLLVLLFLPFSALDKILNYRAAVVQASEASSSRWIAKGLVVAGFAAEVLMSAAVLSGFADRLAAAIMAAYCVLTALLWKQFWRAPDFRLKGPSASRAVFWDFLKNLSVAGGFLLLAIGANGSGLNELWTHPFGSTHPYEAVRATERHP